jgi:hypothetical protein
MGNQGSTGSEYHIVDLIWTHDRFSINHFPVRKNGMAGNEGRISPSFQFLQKVVPDYRSSSKCWRIGHAVLLPAG